MINREKYNETMAKKLDDKLEGFMDLCKEQYQLALKAYHEQWEAKTDSEKASSTYSVYTYHEYIKRAGWRILYYFYNNYFAVMTENELLFVGDFLKDYTPGINTFTEYFSKLEQELKQDENPHKTESMGSESKDQSYCLNNKDMVNYQDSSEKTLYERYEAKQELSRIMEEPDYMLSREIDDRLCCVDKKDGAIIGESILYYDIIHFAASLGSKTYSTENKKAIIENAVRLRERKYFIVNREKLYENEFMERIPKLSKDLKVVSYTLREHIYPTDFPLEIVEVLLYFYQWSFDENNLEKIKALVKILKQYVTENLISVPQNFEVYHLKEMKEKLLLGESIQEYQWSDMASFLTNFKISEIISEEGMSLYHYPYLFAQQFGSCGSVMNEAAYSDKQIYENEILNTMNQMSESIHALFDVYIKNVKRFEHLIDNSEDHINEQDCPVIDYDGDPEYDQQGYEMMSVQRDVMILHNDMKVSMKEEVKNTVICRLSEFMDYREKKLYNLYINSISGSFRKCLFALRMVRDLLEMLLSNEHPSISSDTEDAEKLYESIDENCQLIERTVYRRYGADVKATLKSISYEGVKILGDQEAEINKSVKEYMEELKAIWERETLIELQNNKAKRLAELRRRIPCLSKEVMEETVKLYQIFLQDKADDQKLMTSINEKYSGIWDIAEKNLDRLYKEQGKTRNGNSIVGFIKPMFTAEYLYQEFASNRMAKLLDYSSIALEYYAALEYFMNVIIYVPIRELFLEGRENDNFMDYMNQKTHDKLVRYRGPNCSYNHECMYGNFGYLFDNIHNAPGLLNYFIRFRNKGNDEDASGLIKDLQLLAKKLVIYKDNISSRRNESAHGGQILDVDKAKAARAIVYDANTAARNVAVELKASFEFLLHILNI